MKKSILTLAIAVALPLATTSTLTLADYRMHIGMETPQGGSLPQGSITFGNGGKVTPPVEPSEPEVVDPFEPVNPACDPFAFGYPGNSTGKDLSVLENWYQDKATGFEYRSCKIKEVSKPKLLTRYASIFPKYKDFCDTSQMVTTNFFRKKVCSVEGGAIFNMYYIPTSDGNGGFSYANYYANLVWNRQWTFTYEDVDRIEFDGVVCNNLKRIVDPVTHVVQNMLSCDTSFTYGQLKQIMNKQIMIEVYAK